VLTLWLLAITNTVSAQTETSRWGVGGALVPHWTFFEPLADVLDIETDMAGRELRVGIVRGSDRGGDWGVFYIRKDVNDGSTWQLHETACVQTAGDRRSCARGTYQVTRGASLEGVELYRFFPFGSIGRRVQIGATLGGGVGRVKGDADEFLEHLEVSGSAVTLVSDRLGTVQFRDTFSPLEIMPIGRAELGVAVLAAPGLKLRLSGGVNFPGLHTIGVHVHYLFGSR
jgi:hypothetical protein